MRGFVICWTSHFCCDLLLDHRRELEGSQVVEERSPLLGVAIKDDHSILGAGDGSVQVLQLLRENHMLSSIKGQRAEVASHFSLFLQAETKQSLGLYETSSLHNSPQTVEQILTLCSRSHLQAVCCALVKDRCLVSVIS